MSKFFLQIYDLDETVSDRGILFMLEHSTVLQDQLAPVQSSELASTEFRFDAIEVSWRSQESAPTVLNVSIWHPFDTLDRHLRIHPRPLVNLDSTAPTPEPTRPAI